MQGSGGTELSRSRYRLRFGSFEVDLGSGELLRKGTRVQIQDKPFRLLAMLLQHPGEVVTREALHGALWPEDTFVDFDVGLNTAIRKLRAALKDDTGQPRYVETVPRRGYRFIAPTQIARQAIDSIAVLPFRDHSGNAETEYLSEGITETLIRSLSQIPAIGKVIARNSVYRFKNKDVDPHSVGQELGVRALLMGEVAQYGDELSISVELLDTVDNRHIWGAQYHRKLAAVQILQDEIAADIAQQLHYKLGRTHKKVAAKEHTQDKQAYQLYLRGRYLWNKRPSVDMVQKAISHFQQAIERDPRFVLPYVGLADSLNTLGGWESGAVAPAIAIPQARMAAQKALELDRSSAEAYASLGVASMHYDWQWDEAEAHFRRALRVNPGYSHLRHWYSHYLTATGRHEESLAESLVVLELDPLDLIINIHLAWHYIMARQYEPAIDQIRKTVEMEPNFHWGYFFLALVYEQTGQIKEAVENLRKSVELSAGATLTLSELGHAYAVAGDADNAVKVLRRLEELSKNRYVSSYEVGLIHAGLGDLDEAFQWMEKAYQERSGWLAYMNVEPRLDCLRQDCRFGDLLRRIGLQPSKAKAASDSV
jgi:TolB-like protein/Flp pilus assembly protein TadD